MWRKSRYVVYWDLEICCLIRHSRCLQVRIHPQISSCNSHHIVLHLNIEIFYTLWWRLQGTCDVINGTMWDIFSSICKSHHILLHVVTCCDDSCRGHVTSPIELYEIFLAVSGMYHSHKFAHKMCYACDEQGIILTLCTKINIEDQCKHMLCRASRYFRLFCLSCWNWFLIGKEVTWSWGWKSIKRTRRDQGGEINDERLS